ncbi:D-tyrosyl-tRNA(Tyr) deacylase [Desulfotomaculum arcticum]|uniref:D-aminoacyl-tRNA deacylase n=1 Tax=Desulfotruncus arcticus DSM 17038 TaxID=1121424 RepID=A0A1I2ZJC6_9FIRM|nr:D-aminoacyl-tRNA deacylase [Desulfotruncus arcticus]SFH37589.1 D-tyrosyl-tRNA(Tyr) deacylase [Desulfotomaculum arcticum] [Desulfotruncus arcticus DSM 17038]
MRAVVQRVAGAAVSAPGRERRAIGQGLMVLLGVGREDNREDVRYLADKTVNLRVFEDETGKMNMSVKDIGGELLVVSQFTLYGDCRKGRRPGFSDAALPDRARELYLEFIKEIELTGLRITAGYFQEHMLVEIMNDGPVTLLLESKKRA